MPKPTRERSLPRERLPTLEPSAPADERRWPALLTLVTSWLMPAKAARRTAHVSLKEAYLVHLLAAVLAVMLIVVLIGWGETKAPVTLERVLGTVRMIPYAFMQNMGGFSKWFVLAVLGTALAIEVGFVALAFVIMSWGARDEPVRASIRHAVVRTWLQTAHALPLILLVGVPMVTLTHARQNWYTANPFPYPPQPPQAPTNPSPGSEASKDYEEAMREYQEKMVTWQEAWQASRPWYVDYGDWIIIDAVILAGSWFLWALLRSVATARSVQPIARPPTCEACGYNLTTMPMESRCPECGEAVVLSLGPNARPGTAWERASGADHVWHRFPTGGRWVAWWRCSVEAVRSPAALGRELRNAPPGAAHRRLWLIHLPIVFLLAPLTVIAIILQEGRNSAGLSPRDAVRIFGVMSPTVGAMTATFLLFLGLLAASVMGATAGLRQKRNLMPYSMQMVSYLGGFFVIWVAFAGALGVGVYLLSSHGWFDALETLTNINDDLLIFLTWFVPNCVCGIWYLALVARGTAAARYANR